MGNPKISVIVPVYKVEPYLRKCLDSILEQSYKDLDIILVDDGSPDNCGAICEEYAARDRRIRVIHQENGGLSAARNTGLKVAAGEYLGFVDSDDWIEPDMYERMLYGLLQAQADISVCGRKEEYGDHSVFRGWEQEQVLNTEQAVGLLLADEQMHSYVWDKLYRRDLFQELQFPVKHTFEDVAVQYRLFLRAEKIICLPKAFYHYRQRSDSIVNDISLKNRVQYFEAVKRRYDDLKDGYPQYAPLMAARCVACGISVWNAYYQNPKEERVRYFPHIRRISEFAREHGQMCLKEEKLGPAGRMIVRLMPHPAWWSFAGARVCGMLYRLKNGRTL